MGSATSEFGTRKITDKRTQTNWLKHHNFLVGLHGGEAGLQRQVRPTYPSGTTEHYRSIGGSILHILDRPDLFYSHESCELEYVRPGRSDLQIPIQQEAKSVCPHLQTNFPQHTKRMPGQWTAEKPASTQLPIQNAKKEVSNRQTPLGAQSHSHSICMPGFRYRFGTRLRRPAGAHIGQTGQASEQQWVQDPKTASLSPIIQSTTGNTNVFNGYLGIHKLEAATGPPADSRSTKELFFKATDVVALLTEKKYKVEMWVRAT